MTDIDEISNKITKIDIHQESLMPKFEKLLAMLTSLDLQIKEIKSQEKNVVKEMINNKKILRMEKAQKLSPSGFCVRCRISNKMCEFMNIPYCFFISRTDVTRFVNQYVKNNNLNDPIEKRFIILDDKLKILFGNEEKINRYCLQKYLSPHIYKICLIKYF